jgi:hypothetical protein
MSSAALHHSQPKILSPVSAKQKHLKVVFHVRKELRNPTNTVTFPSIYRLDIASPNKFRRFRILASTRPNHRNASNAGTMLKVKGWK